MTEVSHTAVIVVAGFGSVDRGDDAVGPLVAALLAEDGVRVRDVGPLSDPLDLLGPWNGADLAVVVDAARSGAPLGSLHVVEMDLRADAERSGGHAPNAVANVTSTHGIGLVGVIRLARAVGQLPRRVVVVGIEGERFGYGDELSPAVRRAVPVAVERVRQLIEEVESCV